MKGTTIGSEERQQIIAEILRVNRATLTIRLAAIAPGLGRAPSTIGKFAEDLDKQGLLTRQCTHVYKDGMRCPRLVAQRRRGDFSVEGCEIYHSERAGVDRHATDPRAGEVHETASSATDATPSSDLAPLVFDGVALEVVEVDGEKWVTLRSAFKPFGREVEEQLARLKGWLLWAGTPFLDGQPDPRGVVRPEMLRDGTPDLTKGENLRKVPNPSSAGWANSRKNSPPLPKVWAVRIDFLAGVYLDLDTRGMPVDLAPRHARWKRDIGKAVNDYVTLGVAVNEKKSSGLTAEDVARMFNEDRAERRREMAEERQFTLRLVDSVMSASGRQRRSALSDDAQQNLYDRPPEPQHTSEPQPQHFVDKLYQIDHVVADAKRGMPRGSKGLIDRKLVSIVAVRHRFVGDIRYGNKNPDYRDFPDGTFDVWGLNAKGVQALVVECRKAALAPSLTAHLESIRPIGRGSWATWKYPEGQSPAVVVMQ